MYDYTTFMNTGAYAVDKVFARLSPYQPESGFSALIDFAQAVTWTWAHANPNRTLYTNQLIDASAAALKKMHYSGQHVLWGSQEISQDPDFITYFANSNQLIDHTGETATLANLFKQLATAVDY